MGLIRKASAPLFIAAAALAGNWLGGQLRASTTGEGGQQLSLLHTTPQDQNVIGLNVQLTNFVPAFALALLAGKPRMLYAFVSGALISALVGDGYERALARWLRQRSSATQSTATGGF